MMKNDLPFVSVIVCAFNEARLIRLCIEGLLKQTYSHLRYEILVIDDESGDDTFAIVNAVGQRLNKGAPALRLVTIKHGGLSVARNTGIALSSGDYIAFIDGDAIPDVAWLEKLVEPLTAGADYVGGRIDLLNTTSWVAKLMQRFRHRQFFGPKVYNDQCIGCNMAFKKSVFEMVGGFDENFVSRGDESTLQEKIRPHFKYAPAADSIVLHERPETVGIALRTLWKSATLASLADRAIGKKVNPKRLLLTFEPLLVLLFPFVAIGYLFWGQPVAFPLGVCGCAVVRRLVLRRLARHIAIGMLQDYGFTKGIVLYLLCSYIQNGIISTGGYLSHLLHRKDIVIPPRTSEVEILKRVDFSW